MKKPISINTVRRLPRYLRKLDELNKNDVFRISSYQLGEMLGLTPSQIRQDLSAFGGFGQQGYGYSVPLLRNEIAMILGMNRGYTAILVGVGNIGRALIDKFQFNDWGLKLVCAFDVDQTIIGTTKNGIPVLDANSMEEYLREHSVDIAVLCVSKDRAVAAAKQITDCGIEAIWNFTNVDIVEPYSQTIVENIHFSDSLLSLSFYLSERRDRANKNKEDVSL